PSTRWRKAALTLVVALRRCETVPTETPASAATSLIVDFLPTFIAVRPPPRATVATPNAGVLKHFKIGNIILKARPIQPAGPTGKGQKNETGSGRKLGGRLCRRVALSCASVDRGGRRLRPARQCRRRRRSLLSEVQLALRHLPRQS